MAHIHTLVATSALLLASTASQATAPSCDITTTTTTTTTTTSTTLPQLCGDVDGNNKLQTSDSLQVLKAAVGQRTCALCVCDMDNNGKVATSDALVALKGAVGIAITARRR